MEIGLRKDLQYFDSEYALQSDSISKEKIYKTLLREHYAPLEKFVLFYEGDDTIAEDLCLRAIRNAVDSRKEFQGRTTARGWIYSHLIKSTRVRIYSRASLNKASAFFKNKFDSHEFGAESKHRNSTLKTVFSKNRGSKGWLYILGGLNIDEIAFATGISPDAAEREIQELTRQVGPALKVDYEGIFSKVDQASPIRKLGTAEIQALLDRNIFNEKRGFRKPTEMVWVAILLLFVIGGLVRNEFKVPQGSGQSLFPTPPPPTSTPIGGHPNGIRPDDARIFPYYREPELTQSGRYLLFSSNASDLVENDHNDSQDVFLFDLFLNQVELVSADPRGVPADGWSFNPSISSDGRWVVFASRARNLTGDPNLDCTLGESAHPCSNIYLKDRKTGSVERITVGLEGKGGDFNSLATAISGDGRWIGFWSQAQNLVDPTSQPGSGTCQNSSIRAYPCLDIFLIDRVTKEIIRIPIGRDPNRTGIQTELRFSRNGRWVLVSILGTDRIAQEIGGGNISDVYLFDRFSQSFEPVNLSSDGFPGNAPSQAANLSPDARYIVFSSISDNLVANDTNDAMDVFLRDREEGTTERVSLNSAGEQAEGSSGSTNIETLGYGNSTAVSSDGRFILFLSQANGLEGQPVPCASSGTGESCSYIMLRDRKLGTVSTLAAGNPSDTIYIFPRMSDDGSQAAYMQITPFCNDLCGDIWMVKPQEPAQVRLSNTLTDIKPSNFPWFGEISRVNQAGYVNAIAFSSTENLLATGTNGGRIGIWTYPELEFSHFLDGHLAPVTDIAFSPTGLMASASRGKDVLIWRVSENLNTRVLTLGQPRGEVLSIEFSPDGSLLAVGGTEGVQLWHIEIIGNKTTLRSGNFFNADHAHDIAFSPTGPYLAYIESRDTIAIQNLDTRKLVVRLGGHSEDILALEFSPDGRWLASGSQDERANLWWLGGNGVQIDDTMVLLHEELWQPDRVRDLAFDQSSNYLGIASEDGGVQFYALQANSWRPIEHAYFKGRFFTIKFAPDESQVVAAGNHGLVTFQTQPQKTKAPSGTTEMGFFVRQPTNSYSEEQLLLVEDGQAYEATTPLSRRFSLSTREFSSLTGLYVKVPRSSPEIQRTLDK